MPMPNPDLQESVPAVPRHIAVVMDGNRRWARERNLPTIEGHRRVADDILEPLIEYAAKQGVRYMTFWAWSTENWKRSESEVSGVMALFRHVIGRKWKRLHEKGVRIKIIGNVAAFPADIAKSIRDVVEQTKDNQTITTVFALNYGGRDEIVRAIEKLRRDADRSGDGMVTPEEFSQYLDTEGIPDPELIVRTGGEQRLSGFLLWQSEYSELYFPSWYMPDFTPEKLDEVIAEYRRRSRRFGR
jgi:undecaprenyl diphosphate synthase